MKLYVVMGGWEYEGQDIDRTDHMEIFTDKLDAEMYKGELQKKKLGHCLFYDFVDIIEKTLYTE